MCPASSFRSPPAPNGTYPQLPDVHGNEKKNSERCTHHGTPHQTAHHRRASVGCRSPLQDRSAQCGEGGRAGPSPDLCLSHRRLGRSGRRKRPEGRIRRGEEGFLWGGRGEGLRKKGQIDSCEDPGDSWSMTGQWQIDGVKRYKMTRNLGEKPDRHSPFPTAMKSAPATSNGKARKS